LLSLLDKTRPQRWPKGLTPRSDLLHPVQLVNLVVASNLRGLSTDHSTSGYFIIRLRDSLIQHNTMVKNQNV